MSYGCSVAYGAYSVLTNSAQCRTCTQRSDAESFRFVSKKYRAESRLSRVKKNASDCATKTIKTTTATTTTTKTTLASERASDEK